MKKLKAAFSSGSGSNSKEQRERGARATARDAPTNSAGIHPSPAVQYSESEIKYGSSVQPQTGRAGQYSAIHPPQSVGVGVGAGAGAGAGGGSPLGSHAPPVMQTYAPAGTASTPTPASPTSPPAPMYGANVPRLPATYYSAPPPLPGAPQAPTPSPFLNTTQPAYFPPVVMHAAPGPITTGLAWSTIGRNMAGLNTAIAQQPQQGNMQNVYGGQVVPFHGGQNFNGMTDAFSTLALSNPNAVSSNAAARTVSAEETAQMQTLSLVSCKWCERCKAGITYYSDSFICMQCKFWLCRSCRSVHTTLHSQRIRVQMRQWLDFSSEFEPVSDCSKCSTHAWARLQCGSKDCGHSLCVACFHSSLSRDRFLEEHLEKNPMHQVFFAIYPEKWRVTQARKISPCVCLDPSRPVSVSHCERCHAPMKIGCSIYWCRPCRGAWGFGQWICEPCFLETNEDHVRHKQKHDFIKAVITENPNLPDDHKERFFCPKCQQWLGEPDYATHKHDATSDYSDALSVQRNPDLFWVISPRLKDWHRLSLYRTCDKELVAKGSVQYPDEIEGNTVLSKCMQCQFVLAYNKPATICLKGNCNHHIYCASCTEARRIDHRHKDSTCVVKLQRKIDLPLPRVDCAKCRKKWFKSEFMGIFCGHCKHFAICWNCIRVAAKGGSFELVGGLPHPIAQNNNKCPASDWILIYERVQSARRA